MIAPVPAGRDALTIEPVTSLTDEVRVLIAALDRELVAGYLPEQHHGLPAEALFGPRMRFFVARIRGVAVGCCGVALLDGFAEVKRMFVRDTARGNGVAQALLARVEAEAAGSGRTILRLETGVLQQAAIRLYERAAFRRCEPFAEYASMPGRAIATSIFYEKRLRDDGSSLTLGASPDS